MTPTAPTTKTTKMFKMKTRKAYNYTYNNSDYSYGGAIIPVTVSAIQNTTAATATGEGSAAPGFDVTSSLSPSLFERPLPKASLPSVKSYIEFALPLLGDPSTVSLETAIPQEALSALISKMTSELPSAQFTSSVIAAMAAEIFSQAKYEIVSSREAAAHDAARASAPAEQLLAQEALLSTNASALSSVITSNYLRGAFTSFEYTPQLIRVLSAFTADALVHFHPSLWIKYDRKSILSLANLSKFSSSHQEAIIQAAHALFDLNMRVVGSTNPIPCYNIPWLQLTAQDQEDQKTQDQEEAPVPLPVLASTPVPALPLDMPLQKAYNQIISLVSSIIRVAAPSLLEEKKSAKRTRRKK